VAGQIAGRFTVVPAAVFACGTAEQREQWRALGSVVGMDGRGDPVELPSLRGGEVDRGGPRAALRICCGQCQVAVLVEEGLGMCDEIVVRHGSSCPS
jgi:hypothetical protein